MKAINTIVAIFLIASSAFSQCGETQFFGLDLDSKPELIDSDSDGHLILTIRINNSTRLKKMDHAQNTINTLTLGGSNSNAIIKDFAIDKDNNIYVCGSFKTGVGLGNGFSFSASGVSHSIFIAKINHDFQTQWAHVSTGPSNATGYGNDYAHSITVDTLGGVYFSGRMTGSFEFQGQDLSLPVSNSRMFVAKVNPNDGLMEWTKFQASNTGSLYPMLETSELGGLYEVINYHGNFTDELGTTYSSGGTTSNWYCSLVMYYDSLGTQYWSKHVQGGGQALSFDLDEQGDLLMVGTVGDTMIVESDTLFNYYKKSLYYSAIDTAGNLLELERIMTSHHSNYIYSAHCGLDYLGNGSFLISGMTYQELNFNGLIEPITNPGDLTSYAAHFDNTYTPLWSKTFGVGQYISTAGIEELNGCSGYYLGNAYDHFYYEDTDSLISQYDFLPFLIEFDLFTGELADPSSGGGGGGLGTTTYPFGPNGVDGSYANIDELTGVELVVYPNPATDLLNIQFESPKEFNWKLIDGMGRVVNMGTANNSVQINVFDLPTGMYHVRIDDDENVITKKIIKQ